MLRWLPPFNSMSRRTFSAEFKARVALEALSGAFTMAERGLHGMVMVVSDHHEGLKKARCCQRRCKTPQKRRSKIPHPRDQKVRPGAKLGLA